MDLTDLEQDVQLERSAPNLLADLGQSLHPFLWRNGKVRRNVRTLDTDRLVNLLEPFQELPQLLDPHLGKFIPTLAEAFLEYLVAPPSKQPAHDLLVSLSKAICKLLYTFCKIRGEKIIVQFLGTETRYLELLLSAIEQGTSWDWEERYITLLWLSQLLLAPFDLASISSQGTEVKLDIPGFACPPNTPAITLRVISFAVRCLSSSGKERDAAKILLVRVAMRPDMQQVGVLRELVRWAVSRLHPCAALESSPYFYIGILSFLAGLLSSGTSDMAEYLPEIFDVTRDQDGMPTTILDSIRKSAVSRKIIIKIFRAIALLDLASSQDLDRVQTVIGDLLDFLEDGSTPVRLAASKALSIITLKLDPDMASQVVDIVLETFHGTYRMVGGNVDFSDVKAFQWHGLVLTFSHLLYRRSVPSESLGPVLKALRLGLSFEKRSSTSAVSTGTNVRDAANFGVWALARRYTTQELQAIKLDGNSALQTLATDLVVAGTLDPAGNVRRGSSAALQELIGRNPDMVVEGIQVVQVVDYHAIALRSRAVEVAIEAAGLSDVYHRGVLDGLLGWRGVKDRDVGVRRTTASAVGRLARSGDQTLDQLAGRFKKLAIRDGDERHGVMLCIAAIIESCTKASHPRTASTIDLSTRDSSELKSIIMDILKYVNNNWAKLRNQSMIAEATCKLMMASNALLPPLVEKFMAVGNPAFFDIISDAAAMLLHKDPDLVNVYIQKAKPGTAYVNTLLKLPSSPAIIKTIQQVWKRKDPDTRATILRCLPSAPQDQDVVVGLIEEGLSDYTTTAQGDVGSKVRIEAVRRAGVCPGVVRIAGEKLDKVRLEAWRVLGVDSFRGLLEFGRYNLEGSDDVVRAKRYAMAQEGLDRSVVLERK